MKRTLLGLAVLVVTTLSLLTGPGKAEASCIYNVGSTEAGSNALAFNFSSNAIGIGGYSSSALGPGDSQCWYGVGWSGGRIGITGSVNDLVLQEYFGELEVQPHGWVEAVVNNEPEAARYEACQYYVPISGAHVSVFGENGAETLSASNQVSVGTDCFGLSLDDERPALASGQAKGAVSQFVLVTGGVHSSRAKSVTIHLYGARSRKPLGSVCLQPSDQTALSLRAGRHQGVFIGASENRGRCGDPSVTRDERLGTPRPDRSYTSGCFALLPGNLRIVRYPEDFSGLKTRKSAPCGGARHRA